MSKKPREDHCRSVWLKPRHFQMLKELGGETSFGEICRQSIEDLFQGRNDREYVRVCIEEYLNKLEIDWKLYGLDTAATVTATEDGFRVVIVANKKFSDKKVELAEDPKMKEVSEDLDEDDFYFG